MPPIFDSLQNLPEMLFDDPLLVFAIEELSAVINLLDSEQLHPEAEPTDEEVLS